MSNPRSLLKTPGPVRTAVSVIAPHPADQEDPRWPGGRRVRCLLNGDSRSAGQHPSAILAGKAKHQQPAQVDRSDAQ
jgi:hypothetical protein